MRQGIGFLRGDVKPVMTPWKAYQPFTMSFWSSRHYVGLPEFQKKTPQWNKCADKFMNICIHCKAKVCSTASSFICLQILKYCPCPTGLYVRTKQGVAQHCFWRQLWQKLNNSAELITQTHKSCPKYVLVHLVAIWPFITCKLSLFLHFYDTGSLSHSLHILWG